MEEGGAAKGVACGIAKLRCRAQYASALLGQLFSDFQQLSSRSIAKRKRILDNMTRRAVQQLRINSALLRRSLDDLFL